MKTRLNVTNITILLDGLNNAMISFNHIVGSVFFGFELCEALKGLEGLSVDELNPRITELKNIYNQLLILEKQNPKTLEVEIEINNITDACDGLNNAIIAYSENMKALLWGCDVPSDIEALRKIPAEKLEERRQEVKDFYDQLIKIEEVQKCSK